MGQFDGRLKNAPVVYVLCQIRFSPVEKMATYIPEIQEAFRAEYPNFEPEQLSGVTFAPNALPALLPNEKRWRFETRNSRTGFILSTNQLITHTTEYIDSDNFRERIVQAFEAIHRTAKLSFIQRIGLRYVDLITADDNESVDDYIDKSLIGFRPAVLGLVPDVTQQFLRARSQVHGSPGTLLVKVSRAKHGSELPAELLPVSLEMSRKPSPDRDSIFLDWDHYVDQINLDPDPNVLASTLRELKAPITEIFKAAVTDHAVRRWK